MGQLISALEWFKDLHDHISLNTFMKPEHTIHGFVLTHGFEFIGAQLPSNIERMEPKECFKNAALLSLSTGLTYVEGFIFRFIPIHHAWCIDDSGAVIDPTIDRPEECEYFGIPFDSDFVLSYIEKTGMAGILDNYLSQEVYLIEPTKFINQEWRKIP